MILLIDGDLDAAGTWEAALASAGYRVQVVANGRAALELLETGFVPDAIVTELMLPVMNGFELLRILRREPEWRAVPVLIASANRGYQPSDLGVAAMLRKPVALEELVGSVARVLGRAA